MIRNLHYSSTVLLLALLCSAEFCCGQWFEKHNRKGNLYGGFGWNIANYTDSDIHFTGDDYDFTLLTVPAHDRPTPFSTENYFEPDKITIPQTNIRFGYFITDNLVISGGVDHMKYVMQNDVWVDFEGSIADSNYSSLVENGRIFLDKDFLYFEHTDGLNYVNTEVEYYQGVYNSEYVQWSLLGGAGVGVMFPKSNIKLMNYPQNDEFHVAGFGTDVKIGTEILLFRYFFIKGEFKLGYINMGDILTRGNDVSDRASQEFFFSQSNFMFGFNIPLVKTSTNDAESGNDPLKNPSK